MSTMPLDYNENRESEYWLDNLLDYSDREESDE